MSPHAILGLGVLWFRNPKPCREPVLSQRSLGYFFALGIAVAPVAAIITTYAAAGVAAYVARPLVGGPPPTGFIAPELQMSNRSSKSDRVALLLDSPSYANFNPSFLALALSSPTSNLQSDPSEQGLLTAAQIAGIESRLRLTPRQAEYWPAVASALHQVGRRYFRRAQKVDVNSPEVQRLIETAMPLILQLNEDQKREIRQLVRIIGLETVASQI